MTSLTDLITRRSGMLVRRTGGIGFPGLPNLPNFPGFPGGLDQVRASTDGSTMVGTLGIRYELPVQTERFRPYLAGGLGINNTEQEFRLDSTAFTPAIDESSSHTGYAFSAGAGASVRLAASCGPTWTRSTSACRRSATSCAWAAASASSSREARLH